MKKAELLVMQAIHQWEQAVCKAREVAPLIMPPNGASWYDVVLVQEAHHPRSALQDRVVAVLDPKNVGKAFSTVQVWPHGERTGLGGACGGSENRGGAGCGCIRAWVTSKSRRRIVVCCTQHVWHSALLSLPVLGPAHADEAAADRSDECT